MKTAFRVAAFFLLQGPSGLNRLLLFCVLVAGTGCLPIPRTMLIRQKKDFVLIAHRGASDVAPENTLAAIARALEGPAQYIEIDIHQTRDQQVVVMHDATVNRTTNGRGAIADLTLAELRQLDAGSWFNAAFSQEKVPTLEEVLRLVNGRKKLLIEIKKGQNYYKGIEKATLELIRKHQARDWTLIQSFYDPVLARVWQQEDAITTHKLLLGKVPGLPLYFDHRLRWGRLDQYDRVQAINIHHRFASRGFIRHLHHKGFKTFVWTVDKPADINKMIDRGADGIISNVAGQLQTQ